MPHAPSSPAMPIAIRFIIKQLLKSLSSNVNQIQLEPQIVGLTGLQKNAGRRRPPACDAISNLIIRSANQALAAA